MNIIVTEVFLKDGCKHGRVFRLPIDPTGRPFNYRVRVSTNSFFFSTNKRNYKKDELLYHSEAEDEHKICLNITQKSLPNWPTPNYIDIDSIWEFYKLVGYDYKKKKWI